MPVTELNHYFVRGSGCRSRANVVHLRVRNAVRSHVAQRFEAIGLKARKHFLPEFRLFQMLVKDPDGLTVELNLHGIDREPAWGADGENYAEMPRVPATAR